VGQGSGLRGQESGVGALGPISHEKLQSIAAIRAELAAEDAARDREAAESLQRARQVLAEGKTSVAKVYFQTAVRQASADGDVHKQAVAALAALEAKSAGKVADSRPR